MSETVDQPTEDAMAPVSMEDQISELLDLGEEIETPSSEGEEVEEGTEQIESGGETPEGDVTPVEESVQDASENVEPVTPPIETKDISAMEAQIAKLTELVNTLTAPKEAPPPQEPQVEAGLKELFDSLDFDEVMENKEAFTKFMTQALKAASIATAGHLQNVIPSTITAQEEMVKVREQFFDTYKELKPVAGYVAQVANGIAKDHPEWKMPEVLAEAAKVSKVNLGIGDLVVAPPVKPSGKPTLPGGSRTTRTQTAPKSPLQAEIDELLD